MKIKHKQYSVDHMYKKTLKKTLLVQALSAALGLTALTVGISTTAWAQSNTTGNIYGQAGAGAGTAIVAENLDTGVKRRATPDAAGRFQLSSLPTGRYKVQLLRNDAVVNTREVEVLIGQGSEVVFVAGASQNVEQIQVTARRQTIDVSSTSGGATFTATELAKLPLAQGIGSVIQLAPSTTRGDSRYGGANAPSFGGASAAENAYYINGFPVTNVLYQVGFSQLPFGAIGQAQVITGGYGAEFGRSTGGVVNITTKSGTNEWEVGAALQFNPHTLRSKQKNNLYAVTGAAVNAATDGTILFYNERNKVENLTYNLALGGPIIKDKLFVYVNAEGNRTTADFIRSASSAANAAGNASAGFTGQVVNVPRYIAKLDWNITDNHHLEYTRVHDRTETINKFYGFNYRTLQQDTIQNGGNLTSNSSAGGTAARLQAGSGADLDIGKYTGYLTQDITVTALAGKSKAEHILVPFGLLPGVFQVAAPVAARAPGLVYIGSNPQGATGNNLVEGAKDEQKAYRLDLEWKLGNHTLRVGVDNNTQKSVAGDSTAGGGVWIYGRTTVPTERPDPNSNSPLSGGGLGTQGYYVQEVHVATSTTPKVKQAAQFIEDRYQITKNVLLSLGLRNEQFQNFNGDGQVYVEQKRQIAPRLGAIWDITGDSSTKLFGTVGRYHLQLPTNVAVRGAGSSLNTSRFYTYTGTDPVTGTPTGLVAISPTFSANNELGQAVDAREVAAKDLKAHFQDEFTLGFEKSARSFNYGGKFTYRKLKSTIDDFCDDRPFFAWATRNNVDASHFSFRCALFNPGKDNRFTIDLNGDGKLENIFLTAKDLGYPEVKRTYAAIDLFLERPLRDKWYGKLNYTLSRSKGNTEGQTLSDIGQADVATTQVFDYPELAINSEGKLPNDRTHQIKAYGYYELTSEWSIGSNALLASGRPKNCLGRLPDSFTDRTAAAYGSSFFFCNGVATPRGSLGNLPWDIRFDFNLAYRPAAVKGLSFKFTAFNVFNKQTAQNLDEQFNIGATTTPRSLFGRVVSFTAPRSALLVVQYDVKL